jgi:hypothetical protein
MRCLLSRFCIFAFAALSTGCIEFEEQTMSYRYDRVADELRIFQDYRGIFGGDAGGLAESPLSGKEEAQLDSVLSGQRTFFFENWIFEYDQQAWKRFRADLKDPEKLELEPADIPEMDKLVKLLIDHVRVENGPFYLGPDGKLCGVQSVTFSRFSEIVSAVNTCAPALFKEITGGEDSSPADHEAVAKFTNNANLKLLQIDGNALRLHWPVSRASFDASFGDQSDDPDRIKEIAAAGIGVAWAADVATITLGNKDDEITRTSLSVRKKTYTGNAIAAARKKHTVKEKFDPAAAAKTFLLGTETEP